MRFYNECLPKQGSKFYKHVNIEGPEYDQDLSYFLVQMCDEMRELEQGITIFPKSFCEKICQHRVSAEWILDEFKHEDIEQYYINQINLRDPNMDYRVL